MPISAKVSGNWESIKTVNVKVSGTWRTCKQVFVKIAGEWVPLLSIGYTVEKVYDNYSVDSYTVGTAMQVNEAHWWHPSGNFMFGVNRGTDEIRRYNFSQPFNVATASFSANYNVQSIQGGVYGVYVSPDGTKLFTGGTVPDAIHRFDMSTPFNLNTASYSGQSIALSALDWRNLWFKPDGTKVFTISTSRYGDPAVLREYTLTTPWNLSTSTNFKEVDVAQCFWGGMTNGGQYLVMHQNNGVIPHLTTFKMTTPWDVNTLVRQVSGAPTPQSRMSLGFIKDDDFLDSVNIVGDGEYISMERSGFFMLKRKNPLPPGPEVADFVYDDQLFFSESLVEIAPDGVTAFSRRTDEIIQYQLSSPWTFPSTDFTSSVYTPARIFAWDVNTKFDLRHFVFLQNGTKMIALSQEFVNLDLTRVHVWELNLSTPYNINTMSFTGNSKILNEIDSGVNSFYFSINEANRTLYGRKGSIFDGTARVLKLAFGGSGFQPSTLVYAGQSDPLQSYYLGDVSFEANNFSHFLISPDEKRILVAQGQIGVVHEWEMSTPGNLSTLNESYTKTMSSFGYVNPANTVGGAYARVDHLAWADEGKRLIMSDQFDAAVMTNII